MKVPILNRQAVREIDRRAVEEYGMLGLVLMENAARGVAEVLESLSARGPIAIACGKGNNAGDGFALARLLDAARLPVKVFMWCEASELRGDAAANFAILQKCNLPIIRFEQDYQSAALEAELRGCTWIIDALLGTGCTGNPRPPLDRVIEQLNAHPAQRLAVDLPSGLDCDSGEAASPTLKAAHTVTFVAPKPGLLLPSASAYVGQLHIKPIGVPRVLVEQVLREFTAN